jgi:hypothetical protein
MRTGSAGNRLLCIDQARAITIAAMIIAHFAPGMVERLTMPPLLADFVLSLGRIATPGFAAIFGVTVGLVYLPKYLAGNKNRATEGLLRRSVLVAACALLVAALSFTWRWPPGAMLNLDNLYASYSVLLFYAIALLTMPVWLRIVAYSPTIIALILAAVFYSLVNLVRDHLWLTSSNQDAAEFVRLVLFSGKYAYFLMMGTTFLFMPVGLYFHALIIRRPVPPVPVRIGAIAGVLAVCSLAAPVFWTGSIEEFISYWNSRTLWVSYHVAFGCLAIFMIVVFDGLNRSGGTGGVVVRPLARFGRKSLAIYTAHAFILPTLHLLDGIYKVEGPPRAILPLVLFVSTCLLIAYYPPNDLPFF